MIKDFVFNDIVLYAKGWYERSEDIVDDLSYLFSKIYAWTPKGEKEVATFMLMVMDAVYNECPDKNRGLYYFHQEVKNREMLYKVSYNRAIILWVMSELWNLNKFSLHSRDFSHELSEKKNFFKKKLDYFL